MTVSEGIRVDSHDLPYDIVLYIEEFFMSILV